MKKHKRKQALSTWRKALQNSGNGWRHWTRTTSSLQNHSSHSEQHPVYGGKGSQHYWPKTSKKTIQEARCMSPEREREQHNVRSQTQLNRGDISQLQPITSEFTIHELNDVISKLKQKKSPGMDMRTNEMIRNLGPKAKNSLMSITSPGAQEHFPRSGKKQKLFPF